MKYDVWKDDNGFVHILPQGGYRLLKHSQSILLVTEDGVQYLVGEGSLLRADVSINQALAYYQRKPSE